jgi:hypothetical protein
MFVSSTTRRTNRCASRAAGCRLRKVPPEFYASLCVVLALLGATLLGTSELMDRFEPDFGLNAIDIFFALPLAVIATCAIALTGDRLLATVERRVGRLVGRRLRRLALAGPGLAVTVGIAMHHLRHRPEFDAVFGLAGGGLLLLAAWLYGYTVEPADSPASRR